MRYWRLSVIVLTLAIAVPVAVHAGCGSNCGGATAPATQVNGSLDAVTCSTDTATGWSQDTNTPVNPVTVYFWVDSQPSSYTSTAGSAGSVSANEYRSDLCSTLGSCNHGFTWVIPQQYLNGQTHSLYAYGQDTGSANGTALSGIPRTFQCYQPPACWVGFDQNPINYGDSTTVRWTSQLATSMYINTIGYVTPNTSGSATVYGSNLGANSCATSAEEIIQPTAIMLTSGTSWTVPSDWNSSNNTVEVWGGGGGGGSDNGSVAATAGGQTRFNTTLIGNGGAKGGNEGSAGGAGGSASGGNTNTSGSSGETANGTSYGGAGGAGGGTSGGAGAPRRNASTGSGTGFAGSTPGGAGGGGWAGSGTKHGSGGGGGGYAKKNNMSLTPGSSISYAIGAGGTGSTNGTPGGNGANGHITITYTPTNAVPNCYAGVDYSCTVEGTDTSRTNEAVLLVAAPTSPAVNIDTASSMFPLGASTIVTATFTGNVLDPLVNDNIDSPEGTGLGASTAPDASKVVTFTPSTIGTFTLFARAITNFYTAWRSFASTTVTVVAPPACTMSFNNNPIPQGSSAILSWSCTDTSTFSIENIGPVGLSGSVAVSPLQATDYTGTATNLGFSTTWKAPSGTPPGTLNVSCTPSYSCPDTQTILHTYADCSTTTATCVVPAFCSENSSVCLYPPPSFTGSPGTGGFGALSGHLQVRPQIVRAGNAGKVYWNVGNVSSCAVSGSNADGWSGVYSGSTGKATAAISQQTIFTLTCQALPGVTPASFSETATINIAPVFEEK